MPDTQLCLFGASLLCAIFVPIFSTWSVGAYGFALESVPLLSKQERAAQQKCEGSRCTCAKFVKEHENDFMQHSPVKADKCGAISLPSKQPADLEMKYWTEAASACEINQVRMHSQWELLWVKCQKIVASLELVMYIAYAAAASAYAIINVPAAEREHQAAFNGD